MTHAALQLTAVEDMGLGKTVQTLACIVQGRPTAADRRSGFRGGTL